MKYIAFLRGVNVGGNNKLSMAELKKSLLENDFSDVETYINSGNIIFSHAETDEDILKQIVETVIETEFGLSIRTAVLSSADLISTLEQAPPWWNSDKESKHNAIIVISPATAVEISKSVGGIKPEYENAAAVNKIIYWSAPLKTFSRTRWSKIVGTPVYDSVTIRNANTMLKLAEKVRE